MIDEAKLAALRDELAESHLQVTGSGPVVEPNAYLERALCELRDELAGADRQVFQQAEREERWARAEMRKGEANARFGMVSGSFQCFACKRYKSAPAAECGYCGDHPVTHNGNPHDVNRAHGYVA